MKLFTLGGLGLGHTNLKRVKPLFLLAYVAIEGSKDRHHLAELFWPDTANPLNSLSAALKQLRHFAPGAVVSNHIQVSSAVECDATTFLQAAEAGHHEEALRLYQGPFLSGIYLKGWSAELEEWVYGTREFLAGRARDALLRSGEEIAANGTFENAVKYAETAYLLPGTPELEPEEVTRLHALLAAGNSPHLARLRKDAQGYGIELSLSPAAAREQLRCPLGSSLVPTQTLPTRGTSFVGRDAELVEVANRLTSADCSLLTLTGLGGVGKTRLAVRIAQDLRERYPDGVYFVTLEALNAASLIPSSIAGALGLRLQGSEEPLVQVTRSIGDQTMLLVLDNYEHLLDGATIVTELLDACPNLNLLITSRERLNLEEEWVMPLEGLAVPTGTIALPDSFYHDALRLFQDRAKRSRLSFELTPQDLPYVASICNLVQGLPLGIELAAAWVKMLSCQEIAQEIERTTDFLTSIGRNVPERHKSIRAVFEHSWQLLTPKEQEVLRRLSVFQGGFRREAAAEVAGANIPVLGSLVDKSLLSVTGSGRYYVHPLLHQYARERLAEQAQVQNRLAQAWLTEHPKEHARAKEKHGRYYLHFLEVKGAELQGARQHQGILAIVNELDNIRAAWVWAVEENRVDFLRRGAGLLSLFYELSGRFQEGMVSFSTAVATLEERGLEHYEVLSRALLEQAWHCYRLHLFSQARQAAERGLALARASSEDNLVIRGLNILAQVAQQVGKFPTSGQYLKEALELVESRNDVVSVAELIRSIGWVETKKGNYPEARRRLQKALALFKRLNIPHEVVDSLNALGHLYVNPGDPSNAQPFFEEGLKLARETGTQVMVPHLLGGMGFALYEMGRYTEAQALLKKVLHEIASEQIQSWILILLGRTATAMADYHLAEHHIEQALTASWSVRQLPQVLDALVALSELHIKQAHLAQAAISLRVASSHSATTGYSRTLAKRLLRTRLKTQPSAWT